MFSYYWSSVLLLFIIYRFLWRSNSTFAISRHYRRFDVFVEADANKAAGKYENASIDQQIQFYQDHDGLTHYSRAKLPITSGRCKIDLYMFVHVKCMMYRDVCCCVYFPFPFKFWLVTSVYLFADVPEGCVLIKEHIPITDLFTCLWFNEVDRFTSRDQLSFSTVRDNIMAKVDWRINMFLDCERRNFVIQVSIFHRLHASMYFQLYSWGLSCPSYSPFFFWLPSEV